MNVNRLVAAVMLPALSLALAPASPAQTDAPAGNSAQQSEPAPKKAPRVWTNEDLQGLKGGVNVVGQPDAAPAKTKEPFSQSRGNAPEATTEICDSDRWSAAVAAILAAQEVSLDRNFWRTRIFSDLCSSSVAMNAVGQRITGDYTLDDGTRLHLASIVGGIPKPEEMITATDAGKPFIVSLKKKPLVLTKVDYIVRVSDQGNTYTISKLYLADALTGHPVLFDVTTDKVSDIDGVLQVKVSNRQ